MKTTLAGLAAALGLSLASASAQASIFGDVIVGGSCNETNVTAHELGDSLVVLLEGLGVSMPEYEWGDGLTVRKSCAVRVAVNVPAGKRLKRLRQVYSGGITKSAGSSLRIALRHNVGALIVKAPLLTFFPEQVIQPWDAESVFAEDLSVELPDAECGARTTYGLNAVVTATRNDLGESLLGGLDFVLAGFVQRLELEPELESCSRWTRR